MGTDPETRLAALLADPDLGRIWDALPDARVVGGAVRDALLGRALADIDLATPQPPDQVAASLARAGLRALPTGIAHGTVTALSGGRGFEVTTLRRDVATDGRHATIAFTDDWRADASRRDFTFNALSMDRAGRLFDPFGGRADLAAGRVRFVGEPGLRIAEDFLRVLRFFRFLARYGTQHPDRATLDALRRAVPGLGRLSPERVWSELKRILAAPDPRAAIGLMQTLGILRAVLPEAERLDRLDRLIALDAPADPLLRLAALIGPEGGGVPGGSPDLDLSRRLRLSGAEAARLADLAGPLPPDDPTALRRALADTAPDILAGRARLALRGEAAAARILAADVPVFPIQGRDLLAAGIPAGPGVGLALRRARDGWIARGCTDDAAALLAMVLAEVAGSGGA